MGLASCGVEILQRMVHAVGVPADNLLLEVHPVCRHGRLVGARSQRFRAAGWGQREFPRRQVMTADCLADRLAVLRAGLEDTGAVRRSRWKLFCIRRFRHGGADFQQNARGGLGFRRVQIVGIVRQPLIGAFRDRSTNQFVGVGRIPLWRIDNAALQTFRQCARPLVATARIRRFCRQITVH